MPKVVITLEENDIQELDEIIIDNDKEEALRFLKEKVYKQIKKKERGKLDVNGKTHL